MLEFHDLSIPVTSFANFELSGGPKFKTDFAVQSSANQFNALTRYTSEFVPHIYGMSNTECVVYITAFL